MAWTVNNGAERLACGSEGQLTVYNRWIAALHVDD